MNLVFVCYSNLKIQSKEILKFYKKNEILFFIVLILLENNLKKETT